MAMASVPGVPFRPPGLSDPSEVKERVRLVCAQLAPIRSRAALIDSYERESLNLLASAPRTEGSEVHVLELAYALRWLELRPDAQGAPGELPRPPEPRS